MLTLLFVSALKFAAGSWSRTWTSPSRACGSTSWRATSTPRTSPQVTDTTSWTCTTTWWVFNWNGECYRWECHARVGPILKVARLKENKLFLSTKASTTHLQLFDSGLILSLMLLDWNINFEITRRISDSHRKGFQGSRSSSYILKSLLNCFPQKVWMILVHGDFILIMQKILVKVMSNSKPFFGIFFNVKIYSIILFSGLLFKCVQEPEEGMRVIN